mmetsp:Transcript_28208/g.67073  ORF Transcript_28208/g.67073 Transcript_28208/m.67073 type:complete len:314 (-) Transcript_28208:23-964(-)
MHAANSNFRTFLAHWASACGAPVTFRASFCTTLRLLPKHAIVRKLMAIQIVTKATAKTSCIRKDIGVESKNVSVTTLAWKQTVAMFTSLFGCAMPRDERLSSATIRPTINQAVHLKTVPSRCHARCCSMVWYSEGTMLTAVRLTTITQMPQIAQTACRTYVDGGCRRDRHTEAIQVLPKHATESTTCSQSLLCMGRKLYHSIKGSHGRTCKEPTATTAAALNHRQRLRGGACLLLLRRCREPGTKPSRLPSTLYNRRVEMTPPSYKAAKKAAPSSNDAPKARRVRTDAFTRSPDRRVSDREILSIGSARPRSD